MATLFESALAHLQDETWVINENMIIMLSSPTRTESEAFGRAWSELPLERRKIAIRKMVELGEERFDLDYTALYRFALNDQDAEVRRNAIEGLWEDEGWDVAIMLLRLLHSDPDEMVRASAATSLSRFVYMAECDEVDASRGLKLRTALEEVIDNPQESIEVIRRAVEAIAYINDERVQHIIETTYALPSELMKISAVFAMGRNADPYWTDIVIRELGNTSPAMRYEAARASGEMQLTLAVPALIDLTQDSDSEVQQMAIWALGQIGGKKAEATLKALAQSTNEAVSDAATDALDSLDFELRPMDLLVHNVSEDLDMPDIDLTFDEENPTLDEDEDVDSLEAGSEDDWDDDPLNID